MRTRALEDVVLQMKAMAIANVAAFPFPSAPNPAALRAAVTLLLHLGALAPARAAAVVPSASSTTSRDAGDDGALDQAAESSAFEDGGEVEPFLLSFKLSCVCAGLPLLLCVCFCRSRIY